MQLTRQCIHSKGQAVFLSSKKKKMKYPNKERSDAIIQWLIDHPLLSRSALCTMIDFDVKELEKAFESKRAIPAKNLEAFERELARYGYAPPK